MLEEWLRVFDGVARDERFNEVTGSSRGAEARSRFSSGKVDDSSPAVPCLPANAYNDTWLTTLTQYQRDRLRMQAPYDFIHSPDVRL